MIQKVCTNMPVHVVIAPGSLAPNQTRDIRNIPAFQ